MEPKGGAPAGRTVLGTKKWPTWAQDRFQNRAKIDLKIHAQIDLKTMPFKIDFWSDFGRFLEGKWRQVGTQIGTKIDLLLKTSKSKKCL